MHELHLGFFRLFLLLEGSGVTGAAVTLSPAALTPDVTLNNINITHTPRGGKD